MSDQDDDQSEEYGGLSDQSDQYDSQSDMFDHRTV